MNAPLKPITTSPVAVTDPKIRKMLQLAGLRFVISRARWLESEAKRLGVALKSGSMTSDQVDAELAEMGALDLVYPELMMFGADDSTGGAV
ncbi:MAG TPA: hypothetical protein VNY53_05200 [Bradyrhizobium sp.]|jgi:hypothetical protein|nr:hypothetical protein [Bradyrhizobium sp.]